MFPTQEYKRIQNKLKQNFKLKNKGNNLIFSVELIWILLLLTSLLICSIFGLLWLKNSSKLLQMNSLLKGNCSSFFQKGSILKWRIKNYGRTGNIGTLEIINVDAVTGQWVGSQITKTKNNINIRMTGVLKGSTMSLIHPTGGERWFGICEKGGIKGSIKTTYDSQLMFEMQ
jgi:hypothetical protein